MIQVLKKYHYLLFLYYCCSTNLYAQEININDANFFQDKLIDTTTNIVDADSITILKNSTNVNEFKDYKIAKNQLESSVKYKAEDSIIYDIDAKKMYLYGNAYIEYEDMKMWAERIQYNWDSSIVYAIGDIDDSTQTFEKVYFNQGDGNYEADSARFNFNSKKGKSYGLVTKQLEGFLHTELVKVVNDSMFYAKNARYTTCDLEHPHFYVEINKAKVLKDKYLVGKPANLVIGDVRTPLFLPFAFFPNIKKEQKSSGLVMPTYGDQQDLGFFLKGLGYYWHINDKIDLASTFDIYTLGSWAMNITSNYKKLYKLYGNLSFNIGQFRQGWANERRNPNKVKAPLDFGIRATFNIDPKKMYNSNFGISVDVRSSKRYQQLSNQNPLEVISNTFTSTLSYSKTFPGKPFTLGVNSNYIQNTETKNVTLNLPSFNFNVSRINPFERKVKSTQRKWYEEIGFSYSFNAENRINSYDSIFFKRETLNRMSNGFKHSLPISANFRLFNYLNFNTTFTYNERWHTYFTEQVFRDTLTYFDTNDSTYKIRRNVVEYDTTYKFNTNRDFGLTLGLSTNLYGTFQFKKAKLLKAIRHTFRPSLSFNFRPDFSTPFWNAYRTVQTDTTGRTKEYSRYERTLYGGPSSGKQMGINLNFNNTLELKIRSKKDTITGTKKITILDAFNFGLGYNFAAEKFKLNFSGFSGSTHITDKLNLSFNIGLDPYAIDSNGTRIDTYYWKTNKRFLRFTGMNISINGSYTSKKYNNQNTNQLQQQQGLDLNQTFQNVYQKGYYNFDIPWNINYNYNLNWQKAYINKKDTNIITQTLNAGVNFNITSKWKISVNSGFDATNKRITRTDIAVVRDLHCWQLEMRWSPIATQQSFFITIYVKSQQFNFLRLQKQKSFFDSGFFGSNGFNGVGGIGGNLGGAVNTSF